MHVTNSKWARKTGSHNINLLTPTGRRPVDISLVKIVYLCIHCLGKLKSHNSGVQCELNSNHYGYIHRDEAQQMTDEERFMKLSDMFPSEYLRGIDIGNPVIVTIKGVTVEQTRNRDNNKVEQEFVMHFEEIDKKLRLNLTMAKECAKIINDPEMDTDNWTGRKVTVYRTTIRAFGQEHIVPRIRQPERGDVDLAKALAAASPQVQAKQAQPKGKPANGKGKAPTSAQELMGLVNSKLTAEAWYKDEPELFEAIVSVLGDDWSWPGLDDAEGWRAAFKAAKDAADKRVEATPVEDTLGFMDEGDGGY